MRKIFAAVFVVTCLASAGWTEVVDTYNYDNGVRLHALGTGDNMNDYCYIVESPKGLVLIDSTAYKPDIEAVSKYIKSLEKAEVYRDSLRLLLQR